MQGRSYPEGCTVARSELRYVRVLYYGFDGLEHTGELVCNEAIANDLLDIFRQLYEARYPIESIRLIDDFEGDDERSMRANNTSCFCYRKVNGTKRLSKHAQGLAIDINPLYNPCVRHLIDGRQRVEPTTARAYADRSRPFVHKIRRGDLCHRLFLRHGFRWGGDWRNPKDYQHFEK